MKFSDCAHIVIICLIFSSCQIKQRNSEKGIRFSQVKELTASDSIDLEKYDILALEHITASNNSLYITVGEGVRERVYIFDILGGYKAKGIGVGQGPDEVLEITSVHRYSDRIVIYDARKGVLSEVDYRDGVIQLIPSTSELPLFDDAYMLPDDNVLVMPVLGDYSYALLDKQRGIVDSLRYYPPKPDGRTDFTHSLACTGRMALLPLQKRFSRTLAYDGAIDFFCFDNHSLKHLRRQEVFGMDYDVIDAGQPVPTLSKTTRIGYRSLTASDDMFYALFSSDLAMKGEKGSKELQSFTPDGDGCCKYRLDCLLTSVAVSPDNSVIYGIGISNEEKTILYIYRL